LARCHCCHQLHLLLLVLQPLHLQKLPGQQQA
jgi:hypothetical protein